jgi:hypothetical protein
MEAVNRKCWQNKTLSWQLNLENKPTTSSSWSRFLTTSFGTGCETLYPGISFCTRVRKVAPSSQSASKADSNPGTVARNWLLAFHSFLSDSLGVLQLRGGPHLLLNREIWNRYYEISFARNLKAKLDSIKVCKKRIFRDKSECH